MCLNMPATDKTTLFSKGRTVEAMCLADYLRWACDTNKIDKVLALPPIQRGPVWKPKQIADLWDSLLRRMPIGSFMLSRLGENDYRTSVDIVSERKMEEKGRSGFNLLDGQQRTLAILLCWPDAGEADRRIWIDLGEQGNNGSPFLLRITTKSQPFGFGPIWHEKLSLSDRRQARERFNKNNETVKDVVSIPNYKLELSETRPWKLDAESQKLIVSLRDLWKLLQSEPNIESWAQLVEKNLLAGIDINNQTRDRLVNLGESLKYLENSWVALILAPNLERPEELNDPAHDPMTILFERIATGGTRLSPDDLLFSMIKQAYPKAHNLVQDIHSLEDDKGLPLVGHLMKQTDLVMTAMRLACADPNATDRIKKISDNPNPNAKDFYQYLKGSDMLGSEQEPGPFRRLIEANNNKTPLVRAFYELVNLLKYRQQASNDMGLPRVVMPHLSRPLLQILLYWLIRELENKECNSERLERSRIEILRFTLYWFLCERDATLSKKASRNAFAFLSDYKIGEIFPGRALYEQVTKADDRGREYMFKLVDPTKLKCVLDLTDSPILRSHEERFLNPEDWVREMYGHFWNHHNALLWIQRDMLYREFDEYDALANREDKDNVPYDFDHLCPQAHWSDLRSIYPNLPKNSPESIAFCSWKRGLLGNAIGNFRVIDAAKNRGDSDKPLSEKLPLHEEFITNHDQRWKDSAFFPTNTVELDFWQKTSPSSTNNSDHKTWTTDRVQCFQSAVEHRTFALYCRYFEEAGFNGWLQEQANQ